MNKLFFGDCLEVMREDLADESVDLIYLDPPFNSKRLYNAFIGGAQWVAFNDTWRWHEAIEDFHDVAESPALAGTMEGLRKILGEGASLAYLSYMANRLRECHRALKPTGSIYLHCDPTMSHYLKIAMDGIFGEKNFRNEVVWHYGQRTAFLALNFSRKHDILLFYGKGTRTTFNKISTLWKKEEFLANRHDVKIDENGDEFIWSDGGATGKRYKRMVKTVISKGKPIDTVWDIPILNAAAKERIGYPTQKPLKLLDRIIKASSNEGDVVLDPFCGCGTTIHAAQALDRQWIGIDICVNACKVIENRLLGHFDSIWSDVEFIGMPHTLDHARTLADMDKFRFERWAAALVDGMEPNKKQRADRGIDGHGRLAIRKGVFIDLVSQVKGGGTKPADVQAFNGARQQAEADLGIFTCFENRVTPAMRDAAVSTGRFMDVPCVQIYTVDDFFEGRRPRLPLVA